jgi:SagB-type dehydrogenase family enzyme
VGAWLLHRLSTDVEYATAAAEQLAAVERFEVTAPPAPPVFRCQCAGNPTVDLPQPRRGLGSSLTDVLLARRTCRAFTEQPMALQQLAEILFYTGGWLLREEVPYFGEVLKKCAPSPGARHTIELYPVLARSKDPPPGIYHYCVQHHRLVRVSDRDPREFAHTALLKQEYLSDAPVVFLLTCVVDRLMWKYKTPRAYRHAHLEAGHYCENLVLCATALGLGAFQTGAIADSLIEDALGIDGEREFVIYAAGAGHAAPEPPADWPIEVSPRLARLTAGAHDALTTSQ